MAKLFFMLTILMNITLLSWPAASQQEKLETSNARDQLIKSQVETAASLLQATYRKYLNGEMSLDQAKRLGADLLRELRYGTEGYYVKTYFHF